MSAESPRSWLFVHAHPDDETLATGIAMAHLRAHGDAVHLLTCTLGEEGEVIPVELKQLEGHPEDLLAPHRLGELTEAMARLGVPFRILGAGAPHERRGRLNGGLSTYRDSGMAGSAAAARLDAWVNADLAVAAALIAEEIERVGADVVVTYDEQGGYGHPDHIQTRRAVDAARELLGDRAPQLWEIRLPESWAREDRAWLAHHLDPELGLEILAEDAAYPVSVIADDRVTVTIEDVDVLPQVNAALRAHATQVTVISDEIHALSNNIAARTTTRQAFRQVR